MYLNHRRDGRLFERAMERDNAEAFAAMAAGAMSPDPLPELHPEGPRCPNCNGSGGWLRGSGDYEECWQCEGSGRAANECFGCGHEILGETYTDWNGEPLCGVCAYAADGDHY